MTDDGGDDPRKTPFLAIFSYVFGFVLILAALAYLAHLILR